MFTRSADLALEAVLTACVDARIRFSKTLAMSFRTPWRARGEAGSTLGPERCAASEAYKSSELEWVSAFVVNHLANHKLQHQLNNNVKK